jgi:hypothetical protein
MLRVKYSSIILFGALALHSLISKLIFDKINLTSNIVVDEEFHLQLGEAYCKYEFDKVTYYDRSNSNKIDDFSGTLKLQHFLVCTY